MALITPVAPVAESTSVKALKRFAKTLGAVVVAAAAAWVVGPGFGDVVGKEYAVLIAAILAPILSAAQKALTEENLDPNNG